MKCNFPLLFNETWSNFQPDVWIDLRETAMKARPRPAVRGSKRSSEQQQTFVMITNIANRY